MKKYFRKFTTKSSFRKSYLSISVGKDLHPDLVVLKVGFENEPSKSVTRLKMTSLMDTLTIVEMSGHSILSQVGTRSLHPPDERHFRLGAPTVSRA
jgi:hypothetical protein